MGVSGRKSSTIRVAVRRLRVWPSDHHTPRKPTPRRSSQTRECTAACSSMLEKTQLSVLATFCLSARFLRVRWFRTLRRRLVTVVLWAEPLVTMSPLLDTTRTRARRESSFPVVQRRLSSSSSHEDGTKHLASGKPVKADFNQKDETHECQSFGWNYIKSFIVLKKKKKKKKKVLALIPLL